MLTGKAFSSASVGGAGEVVAAEDQLDMVEFWFLRV